VLGKIFPFQFHHQLTLRSGQFHQYFTHAFFVRKCFFHQNVTREKLHEALWCEKRASKMLMKLTRRKLIMSPGFMLKSVRHLPNLCAAFTGHSPVNASHLVWEKKLHEYVDEIDPCCQFHQRFTCAFFVRIFCQSQNVTRKSYQNEVRTNNSYVKTLLKLTRSLVILMTKGKKYLLC